MPLSSYRSSVRSIHIVREFNAPIEKEWTAFTDAEVLDKWFGPKPWKVETKIINFEVGGVWLYAMVSPDGQKHWTQYEFTAIEDGVAYSTTGMFADENGNTTGGGAPKTYRDVRFSALGSDRSMIDTMITFTDEATIKMFTERGFKDGTAATLDQLDELLASA